MEEIEYLTDGSWRPIRDEKEKDRERENNHTPEYPVVDICKILLCLKKDLAALNKLKTRFYSQDNSYGRQFNPNFPKNPYQSRSFVV